MEESIGHPSREAANTSGSETIGAAGYNERFFNGHPELRDRFDAAFMADLTEYWRSTVRDEFDKPLTQEEEAAELDKALDREMSFFAKVYGAATYMAERFPGTVTLLFDIDNTLREPGENLARPAFKLAVNLLGERLGPRLEVGLLTTIPLGGLEMERGGPVYLDGVRQSLNTDFFFCSGEYELEGGPTDALAGWNNKGQIVDDLARKHPEHSFVLIDDLKAKHMTQPTSPRAIHVAVTAEIHNDLWRQAAMTA